MDSFSKVLKDHISRLDIKIQSLAFISGVDRSLIQKMIKGDRVPADKDILERIILCLMLTPRQAVELRNLYHIARIGEEVYQRHLLVKEVLECFGTVYNKSDSIIRTNYTHTFENVNENAVFNGTHDINHLVKTVIEMEAAKKDASIKLVIQPDYTFLIEHLAIMGGTYNNLCIEHIFCLQESIKEKDENRYNLNCIKNIAPLLTSGCSYHPFIYYDNVSSHINNTSIFPYIIITTDYVVAISYNYTHAVLYQDISFHKLFTTIYNNIKFYTIALVEKLPSPMNTYSYYNKPEPMNNRVLNESEVCFTMFTQPCLMFFLTRAILDRYTIDFPGKEMLLDAICMKSKDYLTKIKSGYDYTTYFTLEGLRDFWNTGRIREIPDAFYTPLNKQDRLYLINMLYDISEKYNYNTILVNNEVLSLTDRLVVTATDDSSISLIFYQPSKEAISFTIKEKSLTYSFFRFFEYLKSSDFTVSKHESLELLREQLDLFTKELHEDEATLENL
jgi:hypothetical protein